MRGVALGCGERGVSAFDASLEHVLGRHTMILPLLTIAVATLAFLAAGVDIRLCLLSVALFPVAAGVSLAWSGRNHSQSFGSDARLILAVSLAFAATWLGLAFNTESFDWSHPQRHEAWRQMHGASTHHYITGMVGGFPLQAIEGHGGGGAPEFLPAGKGLGALVANFWLLIAACSVLSYLVPRRAAMRAAWTVALTAPLCGFLGFRVLLIMLD